jgi:Fur family peroxide stress response transcriptional regulator
VDERVQQMLSGVRAAGLKLTPQRIAIVRAIAGDPSHPTAQEIFDRLQSSMPTMSFATVYNTLDALAGAGLCGSLSLLPGPSRFDPNMTPHHHAVCEGCGLVRDIERAPSDAAHSTSRLDAAPALAGFEVRAVEHIYRGLCAACAARDNPREGRHS